jgi:galactose-1-phosphate uridylyltransferase
MKQSNAPTDTTECAFCGGNCGQCGGTSGTQHERIRLLARETYQKVRQAHPNMPHEESPAGHKKIQRLFDILWKPFRDAVDESAETHG